MTTTQPTRILHVTQPTSGGTAEVVRRLAVGASPQFEVSIASPDMDDFGAWAATAGPDWIPLSLVRAPSFTDLTAVLRLRQLMRQFDVVHLHSSKAGAVGRLAAATIRRRRRPRIVFTPHAWSWYVGGRMAIAYRRFEKWAQRISDHIIVVSQAELADGRNVLGPGAPLVVIENGVDTVSFSPAGPAVARPPHPVIVSVGRLSRQKGLDRLIRAFAAMERVDSKLILVGEGEDEADLRGLSQRVGVSARVEFVGSTDPRPYLRAADAVVLPSRWEGMSLVLLEAMACGAPIVTTNCGGSDALGDAGLTVPAEDDDACERGLVSAVNALLADEALRERLGAAARHRAVALYDLSLVIKKYEQIWAEYGELRHRG